jgi:hypothetical protein
MNINEQKYKLYFCNVNNRYMHATGLHCFELWLSVFNTTIKNISFISSKSILLLKETGIPRENHILYLSNKIVSSTPC